MNLQVRSISINELTVSSQEKEKAERPGGQNIKGAVNIHHMVPACGLYVV